MGVRTFSPLNLSSTRNSCDEENMPLTCRNVKCGDGLKIFLSTVPSGSNCCIAAYFKDGAIRTCDSSSSNDS